MSRDSSKRRATEPAYLLFDPAVTPSSDKRPAALTVGALLVVFRALGTIWLIKAVIDEWPQIREETGLAAEEGRLFLRVVTGAEIAWIVGLFVVAFLMWRGGNAARLLVMTLVTISITASAVTYFTVGSEITIHTSLLALAFDILILLTLSGRDVRAWTRNRKRLA